jgi:hypothetical protein
MHSNFKIRGQQDIEAADAAIMAVLRVLLETREIDYERVRHLMVGIVGDDPALRARAQWFVEWMSGDLDSDGQRQF